MDSLEGSTYEETEELKTTIADQLAEVVCSLINLSILLWCC